MNTPARDMKFTDGMERQLILNEIDVHEHAEEEDMTDRVMKPLVLISLAIGVPLVTTLLH
jgi:hypothetical protein